MCELPYLRHLGTGYAATPVGNFNGNIFRSLYDNDFDWGYSFASGTTFYVSVSGVGVNVCIYSVPCITKKENVRTGIENHLHVKFDINRGDRIMK